jgi:hypothetical protein
MVLKAAILEPEHNGLKVALRTEAAGMAKLHAALGAAVEVQNH